MYATNIVWSHINYYLLTVQCSAPCMSWDTHIVPAKTVSLTNNMMGDDDIIMIGHCKSIDRHNRFLCTSGKNFIKVTRVGMGAAKSNETR